MADTEKTDKQQPRILLFMAMEKKEKQQAVAVQLVSLWTLFNAVVAAVAFAVAYTLSVYTTTSCDLVLRQVIKPATAHSLIR